MPDAEEPRVLLFGGSGQLGSALARTFSGAALEAHDRHSCNLLDEGALRRTLRRSKPRIVINAAAYTNVDRAETERDICLAANARAPEIMAKEAAAIGARFIHYSTDYVFDGKKTTPYTETDAPHPLNVYGESKLLGETSALKENAQTTVFRLSWVYGFEGHNFPRTILDLAEKQDRVEVVDDQFGAPTFAGHVARVTKACIAQMMENPQQPQWCGLFHLAPGGSTSWHDYACFIVRHAEQYGLRLRLNGNNIIPVASTSRTSRAARPGYSIFDTSKLSRVFGIKLPMWDSDLKMFLDEFLTGRPHD